MRGISESINALEVEHILLLLSIPLLFVIPLFCMGISKTQKEHCCQPELYGCFCTPNYHTLCTTLCFLQPNVFDYTINGKPFMKGQTWTYFLSFLICKAVQKGKTLLPLLTCEWLWATLYYTLKSTHISKIMFFHLISLLEKILTLFRTFWLLIIFIQRALESQTCSWPWITLTLEYSYSRVKADW